MDKKNLILGSGARPLVPSFIWLVHQHVRIWDCQENFLKPNHSKMNSIVLATRSGCFSPSTHFTLCGFAEYFSL